MSRILRQAYGRGGSRRVLVAAPVAGGAESPPWLKLLVVAVCLLVPALVSRYSLPHLVKPVTVIDMSRLMAPPVIESPIRPVARESLPPAAKPEAPLPHVVSAAPRRLTAPPPEQVTPPVISRPAPPRTAEEESYQPHPARPRQRPTADVETTPAVRVRRDAPLREAASEQEVAISRTRSRTAALPSAVTPFVPSLRHAVAVEEPPPRVTAAVRRPPRPGEAPETGQGSAPRIAAARERQRPSGTTAGEKGGSIDVSRAVSFSSLEICGSPQQEEDAIKKVLGVVGSRQSCRGEQGEYRFKGTKRISSFNLMIYPAQGRRPLNRCEELQHAYTCLNSH